MDPFLPLVDDLSRLINEKGQALFRMNETIPVDELDFPGTTGEYFHKNHNARPFFSIQTAAALLYRSILLSKKEVADIVIMDYGAGVGNLYILAKMIGCKRVIYNDLFEDMTQAAKIVSKHLDIAIDDYITADHLVTLKLLKERNIECDIIVSRNVIEHIYDLKSFYEDMYAYQPNAILYFSTTANYHNPGNLMYHKYLHKKVERSFCKPRREGIIKDRFPELSATVLQQVTEATRGLAVGDLDAALDIYAQKGTLPDPSIFSTNTCDPVTGMWIENLLSKSEYRNILEPIGYQMSFLPAFWDTHYASGWKNVFGKILNAATRFLGDKAGLRTTAFIYVVATKK